MKKVVFFILLATLLIVAGQAFAQNEWRERCLDDNGYMLPGMGPHCDYAFWDFLGLPRLVYGNWEDHDMIWANPTPNRNQGIWDEEIILGTDLGVAASVGNTNYFFFGDTACRIAEGDELHCLANSVPYAVVEVTNELPFWESDYLIDDVHDYTASGTIRSVTELAGRDNIINDLEQELGIQEYFFWVPTGAFWSDYSEKIYYSYGKYIACETCDRSLLLSFDPYAQSDQWEFVAIGAGKKFIQIAAIPVYTEYSNNPAGLPLKQSQGPGGEYGILIYGSGLTTNNSYGFYATTPSNCPNSETSYRQSHVYLSYIEAGDFEAGNLNRSWYYTDQTPTWQMGTTGLNKAVYIDKHIFGTDPMPLLGEFSVQLIPNSKLLLMIFVDYSEFPSPYRFRIAHLDDPTHFCYVEDMQGDSRGYGSYIVPSSLYLNRVDKDTWHLYYDYVASSFWPAYGTAVISSIIDFSDPALQSCLSQID